MARELSKTALARLGKLYAERVLRDARLRPEDMPELAGRIDWLESGKKTREDMTRDIRGVARCLLLDAGYKKDALDRVLGM